MPTELELQEAERKRAADAAAAKKLSDEAEARRVAATTANHPPVPHIPQAAPAQTAPGAPGFPKRLSHPNSPHPVADRLVHNTAEESTARADGFTNVVPGTEEPPFIVTIGRCNACRAPIFEGGIGAQGYTYHPDGGKDRTGVYVHNDCEDAKAENLKVPIRTEGVNKRIGSLEPTELKSALLNEPAIEEPAETPTRNTPVRQGSQKIG